MRRRSDGVYGPGTWISSWEGSCVWGTWTCPSLRTCSACVVESYGAARTFCPAETETCAGLEERESGDGGERGTYGGPGTGV